jgi:hypothetical protein
MAPRRQAKKMHLPVSIISRLHTHFVLLAMITVDVIVYTHLLQAWLPEKFASSIFWLLIASAFLSVQPGQSSVLVDELKKALMNFLSKS